MLRKKKPMKIEIKHDTNMPIYIQLYEQIKEQIIYGKLKSGDKIPSYRELAKQCDVSMITVITAYKRLSEDKLIEKSQTGCFVSENADTIAAEYHLRKIEDNLKDVILSAKTIDIGIEELHTLMNELWHEYITSL